MTDSEVTSCLKVAVLSDLHAYDKCGEDEDSSPSYLCTSDAPDKQPTSSLKQLIRLENLTADLLLCPGDLGDKARPAGIAHGWREVHDIATALSASTVVGTVGNHDVDSRFSYSDHDPKGYLQSLIPPFPFPDEDLNDRFWSRNFVLIEQSQYRLLVLNSSAFHGGNPDEIAYGRVSERTLGRLITVLKASRARPVNLLLCHHHPHKHMELNLGEFDEMRGGALLLEQLGSGQFGDWLVIHGHKHHPKLAYAAGGASSPIIFSAGSLCAKLYAQLGTRVRNQFYILEFPIDQLPSRGFIGSFKAWDWFSGIGWQIARRVGSGLPGYGGFGYRGNLKILAHRLAKLIETGPIGWNRVTEEFWELEHLLPDDLEALFATLSREFQIEVLRDPNDLPRQLGYAR